MNGIPPASDLRPLNDCLQPDGQLDPVRLLCHRLRTPLTALIGFAELIQDQRLGLEDRRQYAEVIIRSGRTMATILDEATKLRGP